MGEWVGLCFPYALFFEFLAPVIEAIGFLSLIFLLFTNQINFSTFWLLIIYVYLVGITMSLITISYDLEVKKTISKLFGISKISFIFVSGSYDISPINCFLHFERLLEVLNKKNFSWGAMTRQGFTKKTPTTKTV